MLSRASPLPQGLGSVHKFHPARFAQQQRRIQLRHLPDVIPQQGDPLEFAQVLAAVHPELEGTKG